MAATRYGCFIWRDSRPVFLPQVSINTHATLFSSISRTVLTQKYVNPDKATALDEVNYTFPLYDGVSVVGFTCNIGERTIKGVVKEREQAKKDYAEAKENNQFAGLLERSHSAADVFTTSLGNVPPGATVSVEITYLGELKHDAEVDGLRYTVPSSIAPRYGKDESLQGLDNVGASTMSVTVDAEMPSTIKSIQSPSHAVSVTIGTLSAHPDAEPTFKRAAASLSLPSASLEKDLILHVVVDDLGKPSAVLEIHPDLPNHAALMATLVPKFSLPPIRPEIVFLCDRSGSMGGKIGDLQSALQIFLKSIPAGAKFNICSFGSKFEFLWNKSSSYTERSLDEGLKYVSTFGADFGGTEIYGAMKEAFTRRWQDTELEVIMLTDGEIWNQDQLFQLIKNEVASSDGQIRVFSLGVGHGVSTALIEGAARAGNGASQSVSEGEKMDKKVIRTLKACLSPHITDFTLEIKYEKNDDDEFEVIEKVMAGVSIDDDNDDAATMTETSGKGVGVQSTPISLYDTSYKEDLTPSGPPSVRDKYTHLPAVPPPTYLQAPYKIPQLFTFNRTTVYVLMSDMSAGRKPTSVVLRGTCKAAPVELEIEIQHLKDKGQTIHQLAARKAVQDLESDGGWLADAQTTSGKLLKEAKESQYSDLVEREAVRLGIKYQISGKWCSFIAIEQANGEERLKSSLEEPKIRTSPVLAGGGDTRCWTGDTRCLTRRAPPPTPTPGPTKLVELCSTVSADSYPYHLVKTGGSRRPRPWAKDSAAREAKNSKADARDTMSLSDKLHQLASLQSFLGHWTWSRELEEILGIEEEKLAGLGWIDCADDETRRNVSATVCVIFFFRRNMMAEKETWELLVDKAEAYLTQRAGQNVQELENIAFQEYQL